MVQNWQNAVGHPKSPDMPISHRIGRKADKADASKSTNHRTSCNSLHGEDREAAETKAPCQHPGIAPPADVGRRDEKQEFFQTVENSQHQYQWLRILSEGISQKIMIIFCRLSLVMRHKTELCRRTKSQQNWDNQPNWDVHLRGNPGYGFDPH